MAWWREARFGMFIHWGVYAVPAGVYKGQRINRIGEWIMNRGKIPVAEYKKFAAEFNPALKSATVAPGEKTHLFCVNSHGSEPKTVLG